MKQQAIIVGAGPSGLCVALGLAAQGIEVDLLERQAQSALVAPDYDGREIALTHSSMRVMRDIGVWQQLAPGDISPLRRARVMDGDNAGFLVEGDALGRGQLGCFVSNHLIRKAAWEAVQAQPLIRVHDSVTIDSLSADATSARVKLADSRSFEAPLLIAADSRFSDTRRAMGIPAFMQDMGLTMVLARVRHDEPNHGTAWEWFGRGYTRALLPVSEHVASTVVTVSGSEAQELMELSPEEFSARTTARYEGRLGAMTLASTRHAYPLVATYAKRFIGPRFALAGDAAVGMHPVTAHGFNLALASVEHLAAATADGARRHADIGHPTVLRRYEHRHRASSAVLFAGTQTVANLFISPRMLAQPLRRLIMAAGRNIPALPRSLAMVLLDESRRPVSLTQRIDQGLNVLWPRSVPAAQATTES